MSAVDRLLVTAAVRRFRLLAAAAVVAATCSGATPAPTGGEAVLASAESTATPAARGPSASSTPEARGRIPNDPLWPEAWALARIGGPLAWASTTGAPQTVVAVLDTGVDARHPELEGAILPGYDFVGGDADASDDHGHGTSVAGLIAARSDNGFPRMNSTA